MIRKYAPQEPNETEHSTGPGQGPFTPLGGSRGRWLAPGVPWVSTSVPSLPEADTASGESLTPGKQTPTYSKYSAAGVVLKLSLRPKLLLALPERVSEQLGLFQVLLQWVQGSSMVKEEKK